MGRLIGRGGTRVFDETEKPDFRFRIPDFSLKNPDLPGFLGLLCLIYF